MQSLWFGIAVAAVEVLTRQSRAATPAGLAAADGPKLCEKAFRVDTPGRGWAGSSAARRGAGANCSRQRRKHRGIDRRRVDTGGHRRRMGRTAGQGQEKSIGSPKHSSGADIARQQRHTAGHGSRAHRRRPHRIPAHPRRSGNRRQLGSRKVVLRVTSKRSQEEMSTRTRTTFWHKHAQTTSAS
ncbi:hypothetical protein ERJ75_000575200 [Trypanosoma vivax]|nr:hypothetical protein ERJ75_000575200 [Trypanosoma vivax]